MKKLIYILFPVLICSIGTAQSFEIVDGDTLNMIDDNNLKQGFWKIFGKNKKLPGYEPDQVVEEGEYKNSRKQGIWKFFYSSGKVKSEIAYTNSRPNGFYKTYYENGQVEEEGTWKNNRNTGNFKRYYENGQVSQDFTFNPSGKREGKQAYFYENGQVMIEGEWAGGKESGVVTEYYENGDIKAEKAFNGGVIDVANTKTFEAKNPIKDREAEELKNAPEEVVKVEKTDKVNIGGFNGNGEHTMYNENKQISKVGMFKNYRLMEGKLYLYDENGILTRIKRFKQGRFIGDAPLPSE